MKKIIIMIMVTLFSIGMFNMNVNAKSKNDDEDKIKVYRIYRVYYGSDENIDAYEYLCDYLPRDVGEFVIKINKEYDAMRNGGVSKEIIDNYQISKYYNQIIDLGNEYPEYVNLEALGL